MKFKKLKTKYVKLIFLLLILLAIFLIYIFYNFVFSKIVKKNNFVNEMVNISEQNEENIFSIEKISMFSSAMPIDHSPDNSLKDISISQFTDISILLNNVGSSNDLSNQNTIKQLYIDNISLKSKNKNNKLYVNYKNPNLFGKFFDIKNPSKDNRIDFKILNTNDENDKNDYNNPVFYTDCSNPITLGFLNKDIVTKYSISDNQKFISLDGKSLKEANVNLDNLISSLSFTIHIVNNLNQGFYYNMKLDIPLKDDRTSIYDGSFSKTLNTSGNEYKFVSELVQ